MSFRKLVGVAMAFTVLGALASTSNGCSSSSSNGPASDAGPDGLTITHPEGSTAVDTGSGDDSSGDASGAPGTSGKACASAADCNGNDCSNMYAFKVTNIAVQIWPQPVCLVPISAGGGGNCDPAPPGDPQGMGIHFCDGPDDPSAPGICLPNTSPAQSMMGLCLPKCTFKLDGSAASGCPSPDTCVPFTFILDQAGAVTGYGFCQGSCTQDSDCKALGTTYSCQKDIGFCTNAPVARGEDGGAGSIGTACTKAQESTGLCNCEFQQSGATNAGYCTHACVVGDTNNPCPAGYVCDNGLGPSIVFSGDAGTFTLAGETAGSAGTCQATCTLSDAGAGTDDGGVSEGGVSEGGVSEGGASGGGAQCPGNSTCVATTLKGPDCYPPQ